MLFTSTIFIVFFGLVVGAYFSVPQRLRWGVLLAASYVFYMWWEPAYAVLIFGSTVVDYVAALMMDRAVEPRRRKALLAVSLTANLGLLFLFKYYDFFRASLASALGPFGLGHPFPELDLLLPVGISFYTFQTLSYTIDVYRRQRPAESHFGVFAVFVSFFPQLVAGPIERSTTLMPQFYERHSVDYERMSSGVKLMLWGFFKKLVIADTLAGAVNTVYGQPEAFGGWALATATVFFAIQIYCDFSGYSDIAIGTARVLGFRLMKNFDRPYFATSISDFWRRWHISLSTWFRDYVYIPLGGNRATRTRWFTNLFITFVVSGLWHGANWTFVVWGALHGAYLIAAIVTEGPRSRWADAVGLTRYPELHKQLKRVVVFGLVCFAWIFFRAESLTDALTVVQGLFVTADGSLYPYWELDRLRDALLSMGLSKRSLVIALSAIAVLLVVQVFASFGGLRRRIDSWPVYARWPAYYALIAAVLFLGAHNATQDFLYFQF